MPQDQPPVFPLRDAWQPVLPALPLLAATALLAWLIDPTEKLAFLLTEEIRFIAKPQRDYTHLGDMLAYYSLGLVHGLLCLAVIATFIVWLRRLPKRAAQSGAVFVMGVLLTALLISLFFYDNDNQPLTQLGYKSICMVIAAADLPTNLVGQGMCFVKGDVSRLSILAWVPTFSGMGAVAFAAAFAYANTRALPQRNDVDATLWREALDQCVTALQRSIYLLSAVLVSSTLTITLFAHLPVGLVADDTELAKAMSTYATGLSTFWGALFSVTLIAVFAAPALRLLGEAHGVSGTTDDDRDLRRWLQEHVVLSLKRQLAAVFSLLAPLLVGPLSSLLSSFSGQ